MPRKKQKKDFNVQARLNEELFRKVEGWEEDTGEAVSVLVREALRQFFEEKEKPDKEEK